MVPFYAATPVPFLSAGDSPSVAIEPSPAADGRDPVAPDLMRDTVDPLSAALDIARHVASGDGARILPVFDGRRRYDLHIGPSTAARVEGPVYRGVARRLDITLERIAGFSARPWLPRSEDPETVTVWFASLVEGLPPIPVRLNAVAVIAPVRIHLTGLAVGGSTVLGESDAGPSCRCYEGCSSEDWV